MKKINLLVMLVLMMTSFTMISCDDDDDDDDSSYSSLIVGTWNVVKQDIEYKEDGELVDSEKQTYQPGEFTVTFKKDGTFVTAGEENTKSTWKVKDNKLFMDGDEGTITKLDKENLIIKIYDSYIDEGVTYVESGFVEMKR